MTSNIHRVRVAPKAERTLGGIVYASKAEYSRAIELVVLAQSESIRGWARQCQFPLGDDFKTNVDFVVFGLSGEVWAEEVKGIETTDFKIVRRLWPKYGPCLLRILKRKRNVWKVEYLEGPHGDLPCER